MESFLKRWKTSEQVIEWVQVCSSCYLFESDCTAFIRNEYLCNVVRRYTNQETEYAFVTYTEEVHNFPPDMVMGVIGDFPHNNTYLCTGTGFVIPSSWCYTNRADGQVFVDSTFERVHVECIPATDWAFGDHSREQLKCAELKVRESKIQDLIIGLAHKMTELNAKREEIRAEREEIRAEREEIRDLHDGGFALSEKVYRDYFGAIVPLLACR